MRGSPKLLTLCDPGVIPIKSASPVALAEHSRTTPMQLGCQLSAGTEKVVAASDATPCVTDSYTPLS